MNTTSVNDVELDWFFSQTLGFHRLIQLILSVGFVISNYISLSV